MKCLISDNDFHEICDDNHSEKSKRSRIALSLIGCPFKLGVCLVTSKDKITKKIAKPVKVTPFNFTHNHVLNKQMLIKAKKSSFQYIIPPEACQTMQFLMQDGPIHPIHLKNFIKLFYPNSQVVTHQMMFDFHLKSKDLELKYGSLGNVPTDAANDVFDPTSLENAPEHWDSDPKHSQVFKDAIQEILLVPIEDFDGQIAFVKIMKKRMSTQQIQL